MYRKYSVKRVNLLRTGHSEFNYAQIVVPDGLELRRNTVFRNHSWAGLEAHATFLEEQIFCFAWFLFCLAAHQLMGGWETNKFSTNSSLSTCYTHDLSSRESISNLEKMNKGTEGLRLIIASEFPSDSDSGSGFWFQIHFYCSFIAPMVTL